MMTDKKEDPDEKTNGKFDTRAFMKQTFAPREGEVPVPALKDFFPDGKTPAWKVRGLTADEIARCNEAGERNKMVEAIAEALAAANKPDITDGIKKMLGVSSDVHAEVAKRMEQAVIGSIDPEISLEVAVKIATVAPVEFYDITNEILKLTGLGQVAGKSQPSGKEQTSKTASGSQT
ncbi:MAG: hypothetical protein GY774_16500 [Planctomycetes bacterium]|nr:hypothetical protein [Planctomycetota bacterium]